MSTIFHMRGNRLINQCALWVLTSLVLGTTGCATTKIVPGPDRVHVTVYPMHGAGVQEPMTKVARLQCRGNGFLLLRVDKDEVSHVPDSELRDSPRDYVEVSPGRHTLLLMPGNKLFEAERVPRGLNYSTEKRQQYTLSLDAKPNAWYHFCTYVLEEGNETETLTKVRGWEERTKTSNVRYAPFKVLEIFNGKATTVATAVDFHRL